MPQSEKPRPFTAVGLRRLVFVVALLSMGSLSTSCFDIGFNRSRPSGGDPPAALLAFGSFMWGADAMGTVLSAWLAGRRGIWQSWAGRFRIFVYFSAFIYGRLLRNATQDWLHGRGHAASAFPWPGANWDDFARPAIDLLTVWMLLWLLLPLFAFTRSCLCDKDSLSRREPFSIAFLFGWTTIAAIMFFWIRFLTWDEVAPDSAFRSMPTNVLLVQTVTQRLPGRAVIAICVMLMIAAWPRKWWVAPLAFALSLLIDAMGHRALDGIIEYLTGRDLGRNVLRGDVLERWCYLAGRNFTVWMAFGVACFLGVTFHRGNKSRA